MTLNVCTDCVKDDILKNFIYEHGELTIVCSTCGGNNVNTINAHNKELKNAVRSIIRCNFNQDEYFSEPSLKSFESFFEEKRPVFSNNFFDNYVCSKEIIKHIYFQYEDDPIDGISLICNNDNPSAVFWSLEDSANRKLHDIEVLIDEKRYMEAIRSVKEIVGESIDHIAHKVQDLHLYRARIGFEDREWVLDEVEGKGDPVATLEYLPYSKDKIGSPPSRVAKAGRMNRDGFSFLYLSEDLDTAITEVRPKPGDIISIGKFRQCNVCNIIDFFALDISKYWKCDNDLAEFYKLFQLSRFVSQPVATLGEHRYLYTQLIAEELLHAGFEGVRFKSSFTDSANYTIFSPNLFEYIPQDFSAVEITGIQITKKILDVVANI